MKLIVSHFIISCCVTVSVTILFLNLSDFNPVSHDANVHKFYFLISIHFL